MSGFELAEREGGSRDLELGPLTLGSWQLGGICWRAIEDKDVERMLWRAWELGVTLIDSSSSYGNGAVEALLGQLLRSSGLRFGIFAKVGLVEDGSYRGAWDSRSLSRSIDGTLRALGRSYVDVLALHSPPALVAKTDYAWEVLEAARTAGKARFLGLSVDAQPEIVRIGLARRIEFVQLRYNLLFPEASEVIEEARLAGVRVLVNSPMAHGLLSGCHFRYRDVPEDEYPKGPFRETRPREMINEAFARARILEVHAKRLGLSLPELAIRFAASPRGVSSVVAGQRSIDELEANVAAAGAGGLKSAFLDEFGEVVAEVSGYRSRSSDMRVKA